MKKLSKGAFVALAISSIFTTSNLPTLASNGPHLFILLSIAVILFFIPISLVVGELSTSPNGGTTVYTWIKAAFGNGIGNAGIFWWWFQASIQVIPILYFMVGTFARAIQVDVIVDNAFYKFLCVVVIYIIMMVLQIVKPKLLIDFEFIGFWGFIVFPLLLLFGCSIAYTISVGKLPFTLSFSSFVPSLSVASVIALIPFILSLMGIENSGTFISRLKNPTREFPEAVIMVLIIGVLANVIGAGSMVLLFKGTSIDLSTGMMDAYVLLFDYFQLPKIFAQVMGMMIFIGLLPKLSNWIIGPAYALQESTSTNILPKRFAYVNKHKTPTYILLTQMGILIVLTFLLSLAKDGNSAFLIALYLDVAIYSVVYILIFLAYIKLVTQKTNAPSTFEIPKKLKIPVASFGLFMISVVLLLCFFPPSGVARGLKDVYTLMVMVIFLVVVMVPFLIQVLFKTK